MDVLNLDAVTVYGAQSMSKFLSVMAGEVEGVRKGEDIECIHRMRVASRRMRSALRIFRTCFDPKGYKQINKQIQMVTKALGEARDIDVQIALLEEIAVQFTEPRLKPGIRRITLRLRQKRQDIHRHVIKAMDILTQKKVIEGIQERYLNPILANTDKVYPYSPSLYQLAFESIHTGLNELQVHEPFIHDPNNKQELHAMRISAKRMRYTLEIFDSLYQGQLKPTINNMRELQDLLGLLHDTDVWLDYIPAFIEAERSRILSFYGNPRPLKRLLPGLEAFRVTRAQLREATYQEFHRYWNKINIQANWEKLQHLIQVPIDLNMVTRIQVESSDQEEKTGKGEIISGETKAGDE